MASDKPDDDVTEAKARYAESMDTWSINRANMIDDLRFARLGEQWPENVRQERQLTGRPCLTINRLPTFIRQVVNDARQNRPQIEVKPVDGGADIQTAKIFSGIIKSIEYASNADVAYDTGIDMAVSGGFGYWTVNVDYAGPRSFETEITIGAVPNPLTVLGDALTKAVDSSDWRYGFISDMVAKADFEKAYKGARPVSFEEADEYDVGWWDSQVETVRLAQYFKREEVQTEIVLMTNGLILDAEKLENDEQLRAMFDAQGVGVKSSRMVADYKVIHQLMTGAEVLEETVWLGKYIPIIPVYGEDINIEGRRHWRSLIRDARDPQQMLNYWRTTSTELVALAPKAPWVGKKGAFVTDNDKWSSANTKNWSTLEYDGNEMPQRTPFAGIPAGTLQEALNASDDIKSVTGMYDASLGARSNETSGVAIRTRQHEGDISTFHFVDNLTRAIRCTGQILVDLIPKVYNEPKIMRIMGQDLKPQQVAIGPQGTQAPEGIERVYDLGVGNYDVAVAAGPGYTTKREQTADQMMQFITAFPQAAPLMGDMLAKNLDWSGADELAERLATLLPPEMRGEQPGEPQPDPQAQAAAQATMVKTQADTAALQAKTQAEINADNAKAANKMRLEREAADQKMTIKREEATLDAILKASAHGQATTPFQAMT